MTKDNAGNTINVGDEVFYETEEVILDVTNVTEGWVTGEDGGTQYVVPPETCRVVQKGDY